MEFTDSMENLYGSAHGGALFSLIDEAFEISSNSHENVAVALNMNVTYMKPPKKGSTLTAESEEINRTRRTASYYIKVKDDTNLIAVCQALVYVKDDAIPFLQDNNKCEVNSKQCILMAVEVHVLLVSLSLHFIGSCFKLELG